MTKNRHTEVRNECADMFMEWFNHFLSVDYFAEYYGMDFETASRMITVGRKIHYIENELSPAFRRRERLEYKTGDQYA